MTEEAPEEADEGDLTLFWSGETPRFSDSYARRTYQAAKQHAGKLKRARKDAERAAKRGDAEAWARFEQRRAELLESFAAKKAEIDAAREEGAAKVVQLRGKLDALHDSQMEREARLHGLILDLEQDTVRARGQGSGRFTGSTLRIETSGQINRRVTATRLVTLGVFALAAKKKQDDRELFLTVEGDGFQLAVKLRAGHEAGARRFAAKYNTAASGAQEEASQSVEPADEPPPLPEAASAAVAGGGLAGQLVQLAELHASGALSADEFAAAKTQLLGGQTTPQNEPPARGSGND